MTYCVYWRETDAFTGKVARVYRDFPDYASAQQFHQTRVSTLARIEHLSWHHRHSSLPLSRANAGECD